MVKFNADVVFIDMSGQVRSIAGDLTLRASESGGGHIIVGSGVSLRPEVDCDAVDAIDLGQDGLRWKTLFACSGNFLDRPTVNGSGVLLQGEAAAGFGFAGVDQINGISGIVTLVSVNDAITITTNGQVIEFSGIFTQASGSLLENIADLVGSGVVNRLNGLSGIINLESPDGTVTITPSGNDIALQVDPSGLTTILQGIGFSGLFNQSVAVEISDQSTNSAPFIEALQLVIATSGGIYRIGWNVEGEVDGDGKQAGYRIELDDTITLMDILPSFSEEDSASIFAGFAYESLQEGTHTVDLDFNVADTGVFNTIRNARIEAWRIGDLNA